MPRIFILAVLILAGAGPVFGASIESKFSQFSAYETDHENFSRFRFQLESKVQDDLSESNSIEVSARGFYDPLVARSSRFPDRIQKDEGYEVSARSAFLETRSLPWRFRFGLQEVVWGESLHFFSADILHPKDYRDLSLSELSWSRVPQLGFWTGYETEAFNFAFVYFPFSRVDRYPNLGSQYYLRDFSVESFGLPEVDEEAVLDFSKPTLGLKLGMQMSGLSVNFVSALTKDPQRRFESARNRYEHSRLFVTGLTASYSTSAWVFRFDSLAYPKREINRLSNSGSIDSFALGQIIENFGAEWTLNEEVTLSAQTFLNAFFGCESGQILACRIFQQSLKLAWMHLVLDAGASAQVWWDPSDHSTWTSIALQRDFGSRTTANLSYEIFQGSREHLFSEMSNRDQVLLKVDVKF